MQAFLKYELQLQAYADAIAATGTTVAGVAVHWVRRGEVVLRRTSTGTQSRSQEKRE